MSPSERPRHRNIDGRESAFFKREQASRRTSSTCLLRTTSGCVCAVADARVRGAMHKSAGPTRVCARVRPEQERGRLPSTRSRDRQGRLLRSALRIPLSAASASSLLAVILPSAGASVMDVLDDRFHFRLREQRCVGFGRRTGWCPLLWLGWLLGWLRRRALWCVLIRHRCSIPPRSPSRSESSISGSGNMGASR